MAGTALMVIPQSIEDVPNISLKSWCLSEEELLRNLYLPILLMFYISEPK